ncbi:hypothetical protein VARIO8X_150037 [Burkholderiales bacterium 8X]|nr:hypothetical protein VARIO8X_150037 [Burkholderiales bacterium 8X]
MSFAKTNKTLKSASFTYDENARHPIEVGSILEFVKFAQNLGAIKFKNINFVTQLDQSSELMALLKLRPELQSLTYWNCNMPADWIESAKAVKLLKFKMFSCANFS